MTADHHDRELWERYFKPCKKTNLQLHVSKGFTQLQQINRTYDASQHTMHILHFQCYSLNSLLKSNHRGGYCNYCVVLHPRFVVIGKCVAYKLSLFFTCIISI